METVVAVVAWFKQEFASLSLRSSGFEIIFVIVGFLVDYLSLGYVFFSSEYLSFSHQYHSTSALH